MMKEIFSIYKAQNLINGQVYIGATKNSLLQRKLDHIERANRGDKGKFQEAIATYGPEYFQWEQIDTASTTNELAEKEKQYIVTYNSKEDGYNSDAGGGFKKQVYQYSLNGELIAYHESLSCAAQAVNSTKKSIGNACLGYNKSCKGYYWSYLNKENFKLSDNRKKAVLQYDINGVLIAEYDSASEASRQSGLSKSCITRCCRGERKISGGFIWKYATK